MCFQWGPKAILSPTLPYVLSLIHKKTKKSLLIKLADGIKIREVAEWWGDRACSTGGIGLLWEPAQLTQTPAGRDHTGKSTSKSAKDWGETKGFSAEHAFGWDVLLNEWMQSFNVEILNGMWNTVSSFDAHSSTQVFSSQRVQDKRSKNHKGLVLEKHNSWEKCQGVKQI